MEGCICCTESYIYLCTTCKIQFCSKHKAIHEKRKGKAHHCRNSDLSPLSKPLQVPFPPKSSKPTTRSNSCIPDYSSHQNIDQIQNWYKKTYPSKNYKFLNSIKTKYLKHLLAKKHILLKSHSYEISKVLITSDSQYIITSSRDKTIRIWNFQNKRLETILKGHGGGISCIAITSDNNYLVSGSSDNKLIIWNLQTRTQESILGGHTHFIRSLDITRDDLYIISTSFDFTIRIWSLQNRSQEILIRDTTAMCYEKPIFVSISNKFIAYPFDSDLVVMDLSLKYRKLCLKWVEV